MESASDVRVVPVSVVIPFYNSSSTIGRALESVFAQTWLPFEVIIVNDGSGFDELLSLNGTISQFMTTEYPCIRLISITINAGPAAARNVGWEASTQPYLAFLDADDSWYRNKLELQYEWMRSNPTAVLTAHKCKLSKSAGSNDVGEEKLEVAPVSKLNLLLSGFFSTPSVMVRKDIKWRFDETLKYSEDHCLWLVIVLNNMPAFFFNNYYAAIHKPAYGVGGLSSHLWSMEKSELVQYKYLYRWRLIDSISYIGLSLYSILKYLRRLIIMLLRAIFKVHPTQL